MRAAASPAPRALLLVLLLLIVAAASAALPLAEAQGDDVAFFTVEPAEIAPGDEVRVDARAVPGAREYAWRWEEGEAYAAGNRTERHAYDAPGAHVIGLRVTAASGAELYANQTILVVGDAPDAYVQPEAYEARGEELFVRVNASFSRPSEGASRIVKYEWDWGEGEGYFEGREAEEHLYREPGTYTIRLRVTDDLGRESVGTYGVVVKSTFWGRMKLVWDDRASFVDGAKLTLYLAVVATILGFVLAVLLALLRISRYRLVRWPAVWYIEIVRGTPLFLQILIVWLVLPYFGLKLSPLNAGIVALIVNTTAYQAEAIRAGIQAIPTGQMEAAISLGMTYVQAMRRVIVPQAFRLSLPALGNEFIILLKDTSLVSVIGVVELTFIGRAFANRTFLVLEPFLAVGLVYFVMTYSLSTFLRYLEKRLAIPGLGMQGAGA